MSPIGAVGKSAKQMEMSIAVMMNSAALAKRLASKVPSSFRNLSKFKLARLQEELSRLMYSEQGFDALMRPVSGLVCQSLMVSSYWIPGSAQAHAASLILRKSCFALMVSTTAPSVRAVKPNGSSFSTARMNRSLTRTELFAFWY